MINVSEQHFVCCLFVRLERALALVPTLPKPVEWHKK